MHPLRPLAALLVSATLSHAVTNPVNSGSGTHSTRQLVLNPDFETLPFPTSWTNTGAIAVAGLNGSATAARLPWKTTAALSQALVSSASDFTADASFQIAGNDTVQGFRWQLDTGGTTAIDLRTTTGGILQTRSNETWLSLCRTSDGTPFSVSANSTVRLRVIGRDFGTPSASYDIVWSDPGSTTLSHAATRLTAFASAAPPSAALDLVRFTHDVAAGNSFTVDDVTVFDAASPPPAAGYSPETREAWNDMSQFRINKEPARAFFLNYPDLASAVKPLDLTSLYVSSASYKSLNGIWKFHFVDRLADRVKGFAEDGFDLTSWKDLKVPLSWQMAGVDNIWYTNLKLGLFFDEAGAQLPEWNPNLEDKTSVKKTAWDPRVDGLWRFPIGYYRRNFTIPSEWEGKQITLHFGGVQSGFDLYVNGKHVGYSEDSFTPAEFDVTPHLRAGENTVALEVYRWPTGALFEMQDMPQLSGINRDVLLIAKPKVQLYDFAARSELAKDLRRADVDLDVTVRNTGTDLSAGSVDVYLCPGAEAIKPEQAIASLKFDDLKPGESRALHAQIPVEDVQLWSPDVPHLYQWLFVVKDAGGEVQQVARADHGFRSFESIDKQLFLNGKRFLVKGVNHHDTDPDSGKAVDPSWEVKDLELMKQININMVRSGHYPKDNRWYLMCNRIGIALLDEANMETHGLHQVMPAQNPLYIEPGVDRMSNMVMRGRNHPSVLIWSIGNETGEIFGPTHRAMALKAKELDPTRPVHSQIGTQMIYQSPELQNTPKEIDFVSPMYVEYEQLAGYLNLEQERRPFFFCEYAHAMGNAIGDLNGMWKIIRENKDRGLNGGFIWDWVDQSFRREVPGKPGEFFWTSAQDYGTQPHEGDFCLNGVTTPLRTKTVKTIEVGAIYQNIQISAADLARGSFKIANEYTDFNTDAFVLNYVIEEDGAVLAQGTLPSPSIAPSESKVVTLPLPQPTATRPGSELFLTLSFATKEDAPWAKAGHVVATRQFPLPVPQLNATQLETNNGRLKVSDSGSEFTVSGDGFSYQFDKTAALLRKLEFGGKVIIDRGPSLAFDNQPIPNHRGLRMAATHLEGMKRKDPTFNLLEKSDTMVRLSLSASNGAGAGEVLREVQVWTILPSGVAQVAVEVTKSDGVKPDAFFPIIGSSMGLSKDLDRFEWFGRGAHDNYNDRLTGAPISRYSLAVKDTLNPFYAVPHDHGNKEEVRWVAFRSGDQSKGVLFVNDRPQPVAVLPYTQPELKGAKRPYELPDSSGADLRIAWRVRGLGNAACGSDTPEKYRLNFTGQVEYGFRIQPLPANKDPGAEARKIVGKTEPENS